MKKIVFAILLWPALALAEVPLPEQHHYFNGGSASNYNVLEGVALNAAAATRTITLPLCNVGAGRTAGCWKKVRVGIFYTYSAATTVVATATCTMDGSNYLSLASRAVSAGASTVSLFVDTYTTGGADADYMLEYDVRGCQKLKVVFSGASADGSDLVNIQAAAYGG